MVAVEFAPTRVIVDSEDHYAFVVNNGGTTISRYLIDGNGALGSIGSIIARSAPVAISINENGALTSLCIAPHTQCSPCDIAINPASNNLYFVNNSRNIISGY